MTDANANELTDEQLDKVVEEENEIVDLTLDTLLMLCLASEHHTSVEDLEVLMESLQEGLRGLVVHLPEDSKARYKVSKELLAPFDGLIFRLQTHTNRLRKKIQ